MLTSSAAVRLGTSCAALVALLWAVGCAGPASPADAASLPPARQPAAAVQRPEAGVEPVEASSMADAGSEPNTASMADAGCQGHCDQPTPDVHVEPASAAAALDVRSIEAIRSRDDEVRCEHTGCFRSRIRSGSVNPRGHTLSEQDGCLERSVASKWFAKTGEILRGVTLTAATAKGPGAGPPESFGASAGRRGKALRRPPQEYRLVLADGSQWSLRATDHPQTARRMAAHWRELEQRIERAFDLPPAGPPTSEGWRRLDIEVLAPNGGFHYRAALSSSGRWLCSRGTSHRKQDGTFAGRTRAAMGTVEPERAATILRSVMALFRRAKQYPPDEVQPGIQRLVEAMREGEGTVGATRTSQRAVIGAWGRLARKLSPACRPFGG